MQNTVWWVGKGAVVNKKAMAKDSGVDKHLAKFESFGRCREMFGWGCASCQLDHECEQY
ncbi:MAG: hypothetical protein ACU84J_04455 [Gammaproteobacteria bacterium]